MKLPLLIVFTTTCLAFHAIADSGNNNPNLPVEAINLKSSFDSESAKAIQPIRQRYIIALNRLLNQAMRDGNLDSAIAIRAEIKSNIQEEKLAANSSDAFTKRLIGTTWSWNNGPEITFQPKIVVSNAGPEWALSWEMVTSDTISYQFPNGNKGLIVFNDDFTEGSVDETLNSGIHQSFKIIRVYSKQSTTNAPNQTGSSNFFGK